MNFKSEQFSVIDANNNWIKNTDSTREDREANAWACGPLDFWNFVLSSFI